MGNQFGRWMTKLSLVCEEAGVASHESRGSALRLFLVALWRNFAYGMCDLGHRLLSSSMLYFKCEFPRRNCGSRPDLLFRLGAIYDHRSGIGC